MTERNMKKIIISIIALSGLFFPGCQDDISREETPNLEYKVTAAIGTHVSRVNESGFVKNDSISLYMKYSGATTYDPLPTFVYDNDNWIPQTVCSWKDYSTKASFVAHYPAARISDLADYKFSIQQDQSAGKTQDALSGYEASDLLLSSTPEITSGGPINLYFHHVMSKLIIKIELSTELDRSFISDLKIRNVQRDASVNILTGKVTLPTPPSEKVARTSAATDTESNDLIPLSTNVNGLEYAAILLPGQSFDIKEAFLSLNIASGPDDQKSASIKLPQALTLMSGEQRTITLKIAGPEIFVEVGDIQPWTELPKQSGIAIDTPELGINSGDDLIAFAQAWENKNEDILNKFGSTSNVPNRSTTDWETWTFKLLSDIDLDGKTWECIKDFNATFDGQGFTISNLNGTQGLFSGNSGTIRNLKLKNVSLTAPTNIAAIVHSNSGTIENCFLNGTINISSTVQAGVLACTNTGSIRNCNVYGQGEVTGTTCGGIVASTEGGTLKDCSSTLNVSGTVAGGIAGQSKNTKFDYCHTTGNISGTTTAGGIIAILESAAIKNSYAIGSVTGKKIIGGLIGEITTAANIFNCYATGNIEGTGGTEVLGGFIGIATGVIVNCYTVGEIRSTKATIGGFIGSAKDVTINNCYTGRTIDLTTPKPYYSLAGKLENSNTIDYTYWNSDTGMSNSVPGGTGISGTNTSGKSINTMQKVEFVELLNTQKEKLLSTYSDLCAWHSGIGDGLLAFALLHFGK